MTARLLSRLSTRQVEGVLRADAAANEVDAAIRQLWLGLLNHLGPTPNASQIRNAVHLFFKRLPKLAAHETGAALTKSATWGHQTAAEALTLALPTNVLATAAAMRVQESRGGNPEMAFRESRKGFSGIELLEDFVSQPGVIAMSYDPQTGNLKLRDRAGRLREPVRDKLSPERQRQIFRDLLFPPPDLATVRDIVFSRFDGATFEDRLARAASLGDAEKIASGVAFAFSQGKNIRQIAKDILPLVDGVRSTARRLARTDSMRVINQTSFDAQNGLGDLVIGWRLSAIHDQHSRKWHAARHGRTYLKNPGPGQHGLRQMPHPPHEPEDERERPPGTPKVAWNCLLPGNVVQGRFRGGLKSFYSGQARELLCAGGALVRVTANHPILTEQGWVAACRLTKGQKLVCYKGGVDRVPENEDHAPAMIEQVFGALLDVPAGVLSVPRIRQNLHGDEVFVEGHVDVVGANRELLLCAYANQLQGVSDNDFMRAALDTFEISRSGSRALRSDRVRFPSSGIVQSVELGLAKRSLLPGPLTLLRFGPGSELDSMIDQSPSQPGGLGFDSIAAVGDAKLVSELLQRFPGSVSLSDILEVRDFEFRGHVYDLETDVGYYVANCSQETPSCNGIVVSNCRCILQPVLAEPDRSPKLPPVFQQAGGALIPDGPSYSDWWKQADDRRRKIAVGVKRYMTMLDRLQREPDWIEFMDPDTGGLLSVEQLKAETVSERNERVGRMRAVIGERREELERVAAGV